jgi:septal ring factor EnvC (AmiA/AmiB activator)
MASKTPETVEKSLGALSEAIGKATDDLCAARETIDRTRADIAAQNTSISREVVAEAERVIDALKRTDEGLRDVVKELAERD